MLSDWLAKQHLIEFCTLVQQEKVIKLEVSLEKKSLPRKNNKIINIAQQKMDGK